MCWIIGAGGDEGALFMVTLVVKGEIHPTEFCAVMV
jgi:hypothetical protein